MPARHLVGAELDHVGDDANRRFGWADPLLLGDVLLEHIVLDGTPYLAPGYPLLVRHRQVHCQQDTGCAVDGHRCRYLVERDAVKQPLHVVQGRDRHPFTPNLTQGTRVVGVVPHQHRHVESSGEPVLPLGKEELEALVGILRRAETRELAHSPEFTTVHAGVDSTGVRVFTGQTNVPLIVYALHVLGCVQWLDLPIGDGREPLHALLVLGVFLRQPLAFGHCSSWLALRTTAKINREVI